MRHAHRKKLIVGLIISLSVGMMAFATGIKEMPAPIRSATAITEVYGDGQKVSAVAVEYPVEISSSSLGIEDFSVEGKIITAVYANSSAEKSTAGQDGKYVIIELDTAMNPESAGPAGPTVASSSGTGNGAGTQSSPGSSGPTLGQISDKPATSVELQAAVVQTGSITSTAGIAFAASETAYATTSTVNLIVQDFLQLVFTDPAYPDQPLMYNLYVPENYDPDKTYPLVLFMHDAGVVSNNPTETLTQGSGAVIWATPEEQAKHESFVLAPQYDRIIADDTSRTTIQMDITVNLVKDLMTRYSIDPNRLYNTGQSMGGMTSIAMDIAYPELFAASLLVACQWDATLVDPMATKPLWIVVSEGDTKANPGQDAITARLEELGATISKATWDAQDTAENLEKAVQAMLEEDADINYTVFKDGGHRYTWQYAYSIAGIRDWLFAQSK